MSSSTWTRDALASEARAYANSVWRVVEAQHRIPTRRLTDTLEEQADLERLIERTKPNIPEACAHFHYLLFTPFRYAPYPQGSRFRRAGQRDGCFYASEQVDTAIAELAFYRLLFAIESPDAPLPPRPLEHTAFAVHCTTPRSLDLMASPLDRDADRWTDRIDYTACQALADEARAAGIELDPLPLGARRDGPRQRRILAPAALAETRPSAEETWSIFPRADRVQIWREFPASPRYEFAYRDFADDPRVARYLADHPSRSATRRKP
jgi:hypothetical protein